MKTVKNVHSIPFKVNIFMLFFSIFLISSIFLIFYTFNKHEIERTSLNTSIIIAKNINSQLEQKLNRMQTLVVTLANLGTTMSSDHKENRRVLKKLIDLQEHEDFIAGGGIWPEPYVFDKKRERSSYFFGRNKGGTLDFYDDYNDPKGMGYHNEEWYVPAKFYKEGKAYWSKSYIDPYTYQPMVTISVPMYKDGIFLGVSTVDIMLHGLRNFLEENTQSLNGYGFIIDRNNKFISYPTDENSKIDNSYITLDQLLKKIPNYKNLYKNITIYNEFEISKEYQEIANILEYQSYQIDKNESIKIASLIKDSNEGVTLNDEHIHLLSIENDPFINGEESMAAVVFQPNTHWNLVVVIPNKVILSRSNKLLKNIMLIVFMLIVISIIINFFFIKKTILNPISSMIGELNKDNSTIQLSEAKRKDELGLLAFWFNLKVNEVNEEVQKNKTKDVILFQQSRMAQMGEMISMIAHQWRQPLGTISSTSIDLNMKIEFETFDLKEDKGREECKAYFTNGLNDIDGLVKSLTNTIDDFRNFYKPNKKSDTIKFEEVCIKSLAIIKTSLINNNINVIEDYCCDDKLEIHTNEMIQVVLNVLKNAQDNFLEKDIKEPYIKISINDKVLSICDNGGGISGDIINKIFDPYFSTKDEKNGTGLGLYMSKMIIEEHHKGKLTAVNTDDGVCFTIELNS